MPLCVHCATPVRYLYTVYQSAHNVRLKQCPSCSAFADPYIENDNLIVLLDLILLKRGVYRHLLFNRGFPPRQAAVATVHVKEGHPEHANDEKCEGGNADNGAEKARWMLTMRVGLAMVFVDAFIRWTELRSQSAGQAQTWNTEDSRMFTRVLLACLFETVAFHLGITLSAFLVLTFLDYMSSWNDTLRSQSYIRRSLRYSHIPLCLLYSSITKFFLLFLLAVWDMPSASGIPANHPSPPYIYTINFDNPTLQMMWEALDDDKFDRRWVVRNVLGGMAAGFGLRGWAVKTGVADVLSGFVGQGSAISDTWLSYSIP